MTVYRLGWPWLPLPQLEFETDPPYCVPAPVGRSELPAEQTCPRAADASAAPEMPGSSDSEDEAENGGERRDNAPAPT